MCGGTSSCALPVTAGAPAGRDGPWPSIQGYAPEYGPVRTHLRVDPWRRTSALAGRRSASAGRRRKRRYPVHRRRSAATCRSVSGPPWIGCCGCCGRRSGHCSMSRTPQPARSRTGGTTEGRRGPHHDRIRCPEVDCEHQHPILFVIGNTDQLYGAARRRCGQSAHEDGPQVHPATKAAARDRPRLARELSFWRAMIG